MNRFGFIMGDIKALGVSHFILITALILSACGGDQNEYPTSQMKALVTKEDAQKAYEIVKAIDYLPFSVDVDGCYGRSLYLSMELASAKIPSSSQFIKGSLRPRPGLYWGGHVAPLIAVRQSEGDEPNLSHDSPNDAPSVSDKPIEQYIIDPGLSGKPLKKERWLSMLKPEGDYRQAVLPGSSYMGAVNWRLPQNSPPPSEQLQRVTDI